MRGKFLKNGNLPQTAADHYRHNPGGRVVAGGITQDPMNELIQEILGDLREDPTSQHILVNQAQAHLGLPPNANELFHHFFRLNPATRWTLAEVMQSNYVVHPEEND